MLGDQEEMDFNAPSNRYSEFEVPEPETEPEE
jgi:hypothetical protein